MTASRLSPFAVIGFVASCLLAVFLGLMLSEPLSGTNLLVLLVALSVLGLPWAIKHHHAFLVCGWNLNATLFFLPGNLSLSSVLIVWSLANLVIYAALERRYRYPNVMYLTLPLVGLLIAVAVTIALNGGWKTLFGGLWGTKRYFNVLVAVIGYFAITGFRLAAPSIKRRYALWFFFGGVTWAIGDLLVLAGVGATPLMGLFGSLFYYYDAITFGGFVRYTGIGWAALAALNALMAWFGFAGLFKSQFGWRVLLMFGLASLSLVGGHRAALIMVALTFFFQFLFEGRLRGVYVMVATGGLVVVVVALLTLTPYLPLSFQRAVSFLPVTVHPDAKKDAANTLEWRLLMWRVMWPQVGQYFWAGKGYLYSGSEYYLTEFGSVNRLYDSYEFALVDGTYHNGFLTLTITFGVWGLLAFLWFCGAAFRVLWRNYHNGRPELQSFNTFLIAYFSARLLFYFTFYGQFDTDLVVFTGVVGLSVLLNDGVAAPKEHGPDQRLRGDGGQLVPQNGGKISPA